VPLIEERNHTAYAVTLTGMGERVHLATRQVGVETAVQDVLSFIEFNDIRECVLVGHSFAGKVVASVADRTEARVRSIVYVDAFRPAKVRTPQGGFDPSEFGPLKPGEWAIPFSEKILDAIGKDVRGAERKWMLSRVTPWPVRHSSDPVTLSPRFDGIKSAFIFCTESGDPVEEIVAGKWGKLEGPYKVIDSGHWPMITRPAELVDDILELAAKVEAG